MVEYKKDFPIFVPRVPDLKDKGIKIHCFMHWNNGREFRLIFKKGNYIETIFTEIRTTVYGSIAVDLDVYKYGFHTVDRCITTECNSFKQALAVMWKECF